MFADCAISYEMGRDDCDKDWNPLTVNNMNESYVRGYLSRLFEIYPTKEDIRHGR